MIFGVGRDFPLSVTTSLSAMPLPWFLEAYTTSSKERSKGFLSAGKSKGIRSA
ncbi:MAG: hypothetical protein ACLR06_17390 [Christensenellaceae bacterium]